ncbi:MAG: DMT family transporter [Rhodobacteraceae bacterium]|nr:MAG: DMT family transporter [Paracoccaceae bacterium]
MTPALRLDALSIALLLLLASVWGGSFVLAEIALSEVPPLTVTLHRVLWSVPLLALVLRIRGIALPRAPRIWGAWLMMGALNNAIPFSLIFWGQTRIDASLAAILNATTAMFGAVVAGLLLRDEPLSGRKIAGALLGLAGVAWIMGPEALRDFDPANLAQLAVLGGALSYAFAGVWARRALSGQPPLLNAFGMVAGSSLLMIPLVWAVDGAPVLRLSGEVWAALLALSVFSTVLAYVLYFAVLARAGAANVLLVTLLIPPFAIALGVMVLGEQIGSRTLAGFALIALGFAVTDGRLLRRFSAFRAAG